MTRHVHLREMDVVRIDELPAHEKNPQRKGTWRSKTNGRNHEEGKNDGRTEGKNCAAEGHRRR